MRIGTLDNRVTLQHRELTRNDHGEEVVTYATYDTVWSKKIDLRGREYFAAQQVNSEINTEFTIRYRTDVLYTDQIVAGGMSYNIHQIAEIPRNKGLVILASAVPS